MVLTEAFCTKGNYSKALEISLRALQLAEKTGKKNMINGSYVVTGNVYFYSGNYQKALDNYKLGLHYSNDVTLDVVNGYNYIASLFKQTGQADSSISYAKMAISLAKRESLTPNVIDAAALLTELYGKSNIDSENDFHNTN